MSAVEIAVRSVQHYLYCPHRWGLLEIDRAWAENVFVTKANLMHDRVHDPDRQYAVKNKRVFTSVSVYNDLKQYGLYGVTDCLELTRAKQGISIAGSEDQYTVCIVEYKPSKPRNYEYHEEDLMQVFAQKICVDYVFGCDCDGVLYYADVKRRIPLPLKENYEKHDAQLVQVLGEMRDYLAQGKIPAIRKGQKCSGCSMRDLCMPSANHRINVLAEIRKIQRE